MVAAGRYPPAGQRGLGPSRATGFGARIADELARANGALLLAVQVETTAAVANLDELLAVEDLDMIFVGPGDLAASMQISDPADPKLVGNRRRRAGAQRRGGQAARRVRGPRPAAAAGPWRSAGAELVILSSDLMWLAQGLSEAVAQVREHGSR